MTNWASVAQRRTTGRFQHTQVLRSGDCWRGSKSYHCSHTVKTTDRRRSAPLAAAYVYVRVEASLIGSVVEASLSEGWPFRGGLNFTSPTELIFFETRRRRWGQCRDQEPLLEFSVDRVPRKVQALVWDFGRVVAHKGGSNSGLVFGSTRWAPISWLLGNEAARSDALFNRNAPSCCENSMHEKHAEKRPSATAS